MESPHQLPVYRVKGADIAGRIPLIHKTIGDSVPKDDHVLVNDRRRRVRVVRRIDAIGEGYLRDDNSVSPNSADQLPLFASIAIKR